MIGIGKYVYWYYLEDGKNIIITKLEIEDSNEVEDLNEVEDSNK